MTRKSFLRHSAGYILILDKDHPNSDTRGYVYEHRLAVSAALGRPLKPKEVVHHINGKRDDNRLENLELISGNGKHTSDHHRQVWSHAMDNLLVELLGLGQFVGDYHRKQFLGIHRYLQRLMARPIRTAGTS